MSIKKEIKLFKENVEKSMLDPNYHQFIKCKLSCNCITGIKWHNLKFDNGVLTSKNGFNYKLSMKLENELSFEFYKLLKK